MAQQFESQPLSDIGDSDNDLDSLFGDGLDPETDLSSLLFEEVTSDPAIQLQPSSSPPATSSEPRCELTLPRVQEEPVSQLTLPVVPDPLGAPLSLQDGHTSGGLVVSSTRYPHNDLPSTGAAVSGELEFLLSDAHVDLATDADWQAELQKLSEVNWAGLNQDQHVNAPTDAPEDVHQMIPTSYGENMQEFSVISIQQIHGLRYSTTAANSMVKLPRRMDEETQLAKIWEYITLRRNQKYEELYSLLELPVGEGKYLKKDLHQYLEAEQLAEVIQRIRCEKRHNGAHTKMFVVKLAYQILAKEGWGARWFGAGNANASARTRTLFWPEDSTTLLFYFAMFVYRVQDNLKSRITQQNSLARRKRDDTSRTTTPSVDQPQVSTPETECQFDTTPTTSRPCTPPDQRAPAMQTLWDSADLAVSAQRAQRSAQLPSPPTGESSPIPIRQVLETAPPEPEIPPQNGQSFFASLVSEVTINKKRKRAQALAGLQDPDIYEVEIPPNAKLTYRVFVKDGADSSDLVDTPFEFKHTDSIILEGAFDGLMASFEQAQYRRPHMWIQTPYGRRMITTSEEWDQAVLLIYNLRRAGGLVEVDVFV
ncbi:uncharacterized protein QC764_701910 [Podospora pseudoanserina]|uniref:Uncharacterized protein n=1 Tax=Podospora pseudoanserina TaxID=2609844 RepID=A0ABR0HJN0_9PEZI|nr:hypothetical protein QC764_701910 [Podospora pseudoanserina]